MKVWGAVAGTALLTSSGYAVTFPNYFGTNTTGGAVLTSASTVGGSPTQIQYNSGYGFAGISGSSVSADGTISVTGVNTGRISTTTANVTGLTSGSVVWASNGGLLKTDPLMTYTPGALGVSGTITANSGGLGYPAMTTCSSASCISMGTGAGISYVPSLFAMTWFNGAGIALISSANGVYVNNLFSVTASFSDGLPNLEVQAAISGSQVFSNRYQEKLCTVYATTATTALNVNQCQDHRVVMITTQTTAISFTNAPASPYQQTGLVDIEWPSTSSATVTLAGGTLMPGGISPTFTSSPSARDTITYIAKVSGTSPQFEVAPGAANWRTGGN